MRFTDQEVELFCVSKLKVGVIVGSKIFFSVSHKGIEYIFCVLTTEALMEFSFKTDLQLVFYIRIRRTDKNVGQNSAILRIDHEEVGKISSPRKEGLPGEVLEDFIIFL